ncbi:hypothetical protein M0811_06393 [Anaeramoeba ignava]|uniref:TLDc domain-containing protein n=1 Tax=Anaeramoeba ignava TaxID=1746090 RepID=A0A9Q0RF50_ANAIG|nr:hypothetical protein M0811_06393 [Anaeramoeba ignava]
MDNNNNNNQIQNANQNENENEMKNLEKKVTKSLIKNYSNLLNGNSFKDFSIFVENKSNPFEIKVHKSILSSRSPFFNENKRLKGKKEKEKEKEKGIAKKRLFHSFFSLFDKDSISKQDFDKLKQFDFFPKSFLVDIQNKVIQDNQKEIENKEKEIEEKWKKEVENKNKEIENKNKEIEEKNKEIEDKEKEIEDKNKEVENKEKEIEEKNKEIEEKWKKEIEDKNKEIEKMKPAFDEYEKKMQELRKNFPQFSETRIITEEEYVEKLQEWINDNDFFSKMKKGFSAKKDGFNSQNWHKAVDGKGKTLVIIKTKQNFIFGGFTQVGFKYSQNGENINDSNAFIFSLRNDKGDRIPVKFTYKQDRAICSNLNYGPWFGGGSDFGINSNLQTGWSNFGYSYNPPNGITWNTDSGKSYLAGSYDKWIVDELETYFI